MTAHAPALIVLSHLRWDFVFQRPQHLMTRAARGRTVLFVEEAVLGPYEDHLHTRTDASGVVVCQPRLRIGRDTEASRRRTAELLAMTVRDLGLSVYDLWVYTPMALPVAALLRPRVVAYDCMDELANFKDAPPALRERERHLLSRADIVFTGGHRLYAAKRDKHPNVHPFPSSVDVDHFATARAGRADPVDQRQLPHPRLGFYGVLDERFDVALVAELARRNPSWQLVLLGPVAKIKRAILPQGPNLHYLGQKDYAELPAYLAHWDVSLLPFARNASTEFISPTKTPEYLAAGVPVVSTGIHDVVRPYGERGLVHIGDGIEAFERACRQALAERHTPAGRGRAAAADAYLATMSWDSTWREMERLLEAAAQHAPVAAPPAASATAPARATAAAAGMVAAATAATPAARTMTAPGSGWRRLLSPRALTR